MWRAPLARGIGPTVTAVDPRAMSHRVLVAGLAFFTVALALALMPFVARGGTSPLKPCTIKGTSGDDLLGGTSGPDVICGYGGKDTIGGNGGNDIIRGGPGADRIQGDSGRDSLLGGGGNDWIWARDGVRDKLYGGRGYDRYRADQSIDVLKSVEAKM
jgi:hypothetical protein